MKHSLSVHVSIKTHSFVDENVSEAHVKFLYTAIEPIFEKIAVENAIVLQATSTL